MKNVRSVDQYAGYVAGHLARAGLTRAQAVDVVQRRETFIRRGHAAGRSTMDTAKQILARRGHAGGMAPRTVGEAAGCSMVPIEGFFFDEDLGMLPPLPTCSTRPGRASGMLGGVNIALSKRDALLTHIFGSPVTTRDIEEISSGIDSRGKRSDAKIRRMNGSSDHCTIYMDLHLPSGDVGLIIRHYQRAAGRMFAHHERFEIPGAEDPGAVRGLGTDISRRTMMFYRDKRVPLVKTDAAWVGRYVWASFGFNWSTEAADHKADELHRYLFKSPARKGKFVMQGSYEGGAFNYTDRSMKEEMRSFDEEMVKSGRLTTYAWSVASLHLRLTWDDSQYHVGKVFLAGIRKPGAEGADPSSASSYQPGEGGASQWEGKIVVDDAHPTWQRTRRRLKF